MKTYTFSASNGTEVTMLRGEGAPKMTGGGGGWQITPRPRRVSLTQWQGRDPYKMDVPILFDGWADDKSMETQIAKLNQMQMGKDLTEPPTVKITGAVPVKGIRWVIDNIEWGDIVIWRQEGDDAYRLRQDAVVKLVQAVDEQRLAVGTSGRLNVSSNPRVIITKQGDTFRSLSKKYYKTVDKWQDIWRANPKITAPNKLKKGTELRIP